LLGKPPVAAVEEQQRAAWARAEPFNARQKEDVVAGRDASLAAALQPRDRAFEQRDPGLPAPRWNARQLVVVLPGEDPRDRFLILGKHADPEARRARDAR